MKEILAESLQSLFDNTSLKGVCTYIGKLYEVWEVSDEDFKTMCDMSEEDFKSACPDGMWRSGEGSVLNLPHKNFIVNDKEMVGWERENDDYYDIGNKYSGLLDYLCNYIGASSPKNVCACAMDLAKHNGIKLSELFQKYEQ